MAAHPLSKKKPFPDVRAPLAVTPASTPAAPSINAAPAAGRPAGQPTQEEIGRAAYFRWLRMGGDPVSNWLAAEAELRAGTGARR